MSFMKNAKNKFIQVLVYFCVLFVFSSCGNELKIKVSESGINFDYKIISSNEFFSLFFANNSENATFEADEISKIFTDSGFENVTALTFNSGRNLEVKAALPESADDPVSKSGILLLAENKLKILLNNKNLLSFYENLSSDLQSYLDMLMAPTFTGEEMTNAEYIELISEVYGERLAKELEEATVKITLDSFSKTEKSYSVKLVDILNMKNEVVLEI